MFMEDCRGAVLLAKTGLIGFLGSARNDDFFLFDIQHTHDESRVPSHGHFSPKNGIFRCIKGIFV